ncbi:cilia- and flagella-associated protein 157-like [Syngnathoides biaculeatus]|uniref:cilia- and flagella-associated protein 157-like n=1 Tax=Syngnathoides biaculeatus TaxID=300417 RepID=UPI002ADE60C7|nr:cilia- and flagella-associated protein 157-like [Syngnathoides biaculeatus]
MHHCLATKLYTLTPSPFSKAILNFLAMPKKEKKQEKIKKKQSLATPAEERASGDKEKDLYVVQIRFLNEELERQQLKCERLEKEKTSLARRCVSVETEKKDVVEYLKMELFEKEDEVDRLADHLDQSLREAHADRDDLRNRLTGELRELQDRVHQLEDDNAGLVARLAAVETFEKQKEQLMFNMVAVEKKLAEREEEHADAMQAAKMEALLEKTRLEKELEAQATARAAEVELLVDRKLPEASKRATLENQEMKVRYAQLSEKAHQLAGENHTLRQKTGRTATDVAILEETVAKMARQSCVRKKEAEQLRADLTTRSHDMEKLRNQCDECRAELEALRKSHAAVSSRLEAELQAERKTTGRMKEVFAALKTTLMVEFVDVVQWKRQMQKVLALLEGPSIAPSVTQDEPASDRAGSRPVHLGSVPQPAGKTKHATSHRSFAFQKVAVGWWCCVALTAFDVHGWRTLFLGHFNR